MPVGIIVSAVVVVIASFMPWGSFTSTVSSPFSGGPFGGMSPFGATRVSTAVNAWNGNLKLLGVTIPNWTTVIAALAILTIAILKSSSGLDAKPAASLILAGYGILHSGLFILILLTGGSLGLGSLATLGAFVALLRLSLKGASAVEADEASKP